MLTRTRKAFTLLELIVVIVILGILALLAIPTFQHVIAKSKTATAQETAGAVGRDATALAAFDQAAWSGKNSAGTTYLSIAASEVSSGTAVAVSSPAAPAATGSNEVATLAIAQGNSDFCAVLTGPADTNTAPTVTSVTASTVSNPSTLAAACQ